MPYVPAALGWVQESGKCDPLHDTDILQFLHWHIQQDDPTSLHPKHNTEQLYLQEIIRVAIMLLLSRIIQILEILCVAAMAKSKYQNGYIANTSTSMYMVNI